MGTNYTHTSKKGMRMDDEMKDRLRDLVNELTDNGEDMGGLPSTREDMIERLREMNRGDVADQLENAEPFRLKGNTEGDVCLLTGTSFIKSERLIVQPT